MKCAKCGGENDAAKKFCGDCGAELRQMAEPVPVPGEEGVYYCSKHKKEPTRVSCGRCEKPICHKCTVLGPAGVRCRECARNKVPVRARGVLHDVTSGVARSPGAQRIWYLALFYILIDFFSGFFGGRRG
jgi:hypothetical protein